jgi:Tfp pilus assembly protein PilP
MKITWIFFLVIGFMVQSVFAQDQALSENQRQAIQPIESIQQPQQPSQQQRQEQDDEIIEEPPPNSQRVRPVNPAQQALDAIVNEQDIQNGVRQISDGLGDRDPFQRPKYIDDLEADLNRNANLDTTEDERIEAIRRWPLRDYIATAIMWDIQDPKVMIVDRKGTLHLLKKNYRIGNRNGIITAIHEGEIIVTENKIPVVISIAPSSAKNTRQEDL